MTARCAARGACEQAAAADVARGEDRLGPDHERQRVAQEGVSSVRRYWRYSSAVKR